ncbi:hypothetical protein C8J56DRAFT_911547 [Mycena floridula]|nr:hypothetical protein C8J56DRAFT_911547 [Mycena floridula]
MALTVSPIVSVLISIWLETLVYGLNISAYFFSLYVLTKKAYVNVVVLILATLLFLCATAHIGINLCRLVQGYIQPPTKGAMIAFLFNITVGTNVAKQYMLVMVNLFSDILLAWRVYMVWGGNWKITMIPATAINESLVTPGDTVFLKKISRWATAQFSISLAMNVTTTLLIASRIWYVTQNVRQFSPEHMKPYWRVIVTIIESASVAAVAQIIQLAFYETKFPGVYFISDTVVQIVTMAPLIIIVLVGVKGKNKSGVLGTSYPSSELKPGGRDVHDSDIQEIGNTEKRTSGEFAV